MKIIDSLRFRIIRLLSLRKLKGNKQFDNNAIYLTFDDGPEPGITEFVLDELNKYNAKATFFCCGENCARYPQLMSRIKDEGHTIANHTHSHINGYKTPADDYIKNVDTCEAFLRTNLFRPPWGALTFKEYNRLRKKYRIVYWDAVSYDTEMENFDVDRAHNKLIKNTKQGSIVLFHFCNRHEKETKQILPRYLEYIKTNNIRISKL